MADAEASSWRLAALMKRWQDLARTGWDNDEPNPDPWTWLAALPVVSEAHTMRSAMRRFRGRST